MSKRLDNTVVEVALGQALKTHGFKKKYRTWYLELDETILVVNLQKSQWSRLFYINLGVWLKALGEEKFPKEYHCHINGRLESLAANDRELIHQALDLEDESVSAEERTNVIVSAINQLAMPLLLKCGTEAGVKASFLKGELEDMLIAVAAQELLGVEAM
jgi:hypothetical protein